MKDGGDYADIEGAWTDFVNQALTPEQAIQSETYHGMRAAFISGSAYLLDVFLTRYTALQKKHKDAPPHVVLRAVTNSLGAELVVAAERSDKV